MVQMFRKQIVLCNVKEVNVILAQDSLIKPFTNSMQVNIQARESNETKGSITKVAMKLNCLICLIALMSISIMP